MKRLTVLIALLAAVGSTGPAEGTGCQYCRPASVGWVCRGMPGWCPQWYDKCRDLPQPVTTEDELAAYEIVAEILGESVGGGRIGLQDHLGYSNIVLDDDPRKIVVQLFLDDPEHRQIGFARQGRTETRHSIGVLEDIGRHGDALRAQVEEFLRGSS